MNLKRILSFILAGAVVFSTATPPLFAEKSGDIDASVVTVADTASYLTLDLTKYKTTAKNIYLDGTKTEFSNVDNSGKILKTEFNGAHNILKVEFLDGSVVEKNISNIYKKFPYSTNGNIGSPDIVTGHVISTIFDFHTVAKDQNGVERKYPKITTFDISKTEKKDIDAVTTPTTSIAKYLKGQDVVINYRFNGEANTSKFNNIKKVYDINGEKKTSLSFYKIKESTYGKLGISFTKGGVLEKEGIHTIEILYKDGKSETNKIEILSELPKYGNPNPKEEIKENEFDYGKDLVYKYDLTDANEKQKFEKISSVTKVYSNNQESKLNFKKIKKSNVGELRILFESSRPIQDKGTHNIKIIYQDYSPDNKTFIYKKEAPEIILTSDSGEYNVGKSIIFNLKGFEYLFQQDTGINAVFLNGKELKRKRVIDNDENIEEARKKDENVAENESENSWHVVGETFRIKNDGIKLLKKGVNYLTIKYAGYHDSNLTFVLGEKVKFVEKKENNAIKPSSTITFRGVPNFRGIDAVTSGTSGGGITKPIMGGDSESGGSIAMGFKVAFNFDMVANASILEKLGYINDEINKVLNAWEATSKEMAISKSNPNRKVVWDRYLTFVQNNRINSSKYYSFNEYANSSKVITTKNGYNQFKYVFSNGFGSAIYGLDNIFENMQKNNNSVEKAKKILDIIKIGKDIVLPLDKWSKNIKEITVNDKVLVKGKDYYEDYANSNFIIRGLIFNKTGNFKVKIISNSETFEKSVTVLEHEKLNTNARIRFEEYDENTVHVGEPLKFMIENNLQIKGVKITVKSKLKSRKYILKNKDYKYYKTLGLFEIVKEKTLLPGKYTVEFEFDGSKKEKVQFEVVEKNLSDEKGINLNNSQFDEKEMQKLFPGMTFDVTTQTFYNDGSFKDFEKFALNMKRVEINGERIGFSTAGGVLRVGFSENYGIRIFRKLKKGDIITIYSNGFDPYKFFVREVKN